jgi:adenylate kinase family enzyme
MDGNFGSTRELRMQAADTIIMLDVPRRVCMYRAIKRAIQYRGKKRPDMGEGCNERIDHEFLLWVWNYPKQGRLRAFEEFERQTNKRLITLKDNRDIESFIEGLA